MKPRKTYIQLIKEQFDSFDAVALIGPRQCGKTTLAQLYSDELKSNVFHFDLEDPLDYDRLENPKLVLESLEGLIILDEIQHKPTLLNYLRTLLDKREKNQKFLLLGSASPNLIKNTSETLAGRVTYIEVSPFSMNEVDNINKLWMRGGFPRSYLASSEKASWVWRENYIRTFLERDIPSLGIRIPPLQLRRFWMMLAHYHGNIFNAAELARSLGLSHNTICKYIDILSGTFMIRQLQPWFENISKRQVKQPKIYMRDSGVFHFLQNIYDEKQLETHPKLGASWEGNMIEQIINMNGYKSENIYFWRTHAGAELDLLVFHEGKSIGYEFKYSDTPKMTKSLWSALEELKLNQIFVIYPGNINFDMTDRVKAISWKKLNKKVD